MKPQHIVVVVLVTAVALEGVLIGFLLVRASWQEQVAGTPVVRGKVVAERLGCFGCHGPGGESPIPNPGAAESTVPAWNGDTWSFFNEDENDAREWILYGHPVGREPDSSALIPMPAYEGTLTDTELDDLVSYFLSVAQFGWPGDLTVAQGRDIATQHGCFGCHGPEGRGLVLNPLSFKGYIPPWDGDDYLELVRDENEFRQWVKNGVSDRFRDNLAARSFVERQVVPMPAYGDLLSDDEINQLLAFIEWVRANPRTRTQ